MGDPTPARIAEEIRCLVAARDEAASVCPSEVARSLWAGDVWRDHMPAVRGVAAELAASGEIVVSRGAEGVDVARARGPVRLRRGPRWGQPT